MMLKLVVFIFPYFALLVGGKFLKRVVQEDGLVKAYAYRDSAEEENRLQILCALFYNHSYYHTGWDIIEAQSNPEGQTDAEQAQCVGELEGLVSRDAIYIHYFNTAKDLCETSKICEKFYVFLDSHLQWLQQQIKDKGETDPIWHHADVFYNHVVGLHAGYVEALVDPEKNLTLTDFFVLNLVPDLENVISAIKADANAGLRGDTRCIAIVKLLADNQDLLIGHDTWTSYSEMYRMLKKYHMPLRKTGGSSAMAPMKMFTISGYPGMITSGDDFYITNTKLVAVETTMSIHNVSLWQYVTPTGQLFESVRSLIAFRLAENGVSWCEIFSQYRGGTYNNQWLIVDLKKFKVGKQPKPGTLWVLEQIPGHLMYEDQTARLISQGYFPSYNIPFYEELFNVAGYQERMDKFGDWFSYHNHPRALIFQRDHSSVTDMDTFLNLLRYNDYENDPYSRCNCTPPYSAENAIAARSDLNPKDGQYPFHALSHRCHGATDAKATSSLLAHNFTFVAICGLTIGNNLPVFHWSTSDCKDREPHMGLPDSFENFKPITWTGQGPLF